MSRIVAIGERAQVRGFALTGVHVAPADDADAVRAAWRGLPADAGLVILTSAAYAALAADWLQPGDERLWVVMPT